MRILNLALALLLGLSGIRVYAGEALVTRVRGNRLTLDAGAAAGLTRNMKVEVFRPPGEPIYHPITGENLGAPEIEIGSGLVTKVSAHAAVVHLQGEVLMPVRQGDVARFTTADEQMLKTQEQTTAAKERNEREHRKFREQIARLTRSISRTQGRIGSLQKLIARVERVEDGFRVQLRGINEDMVAMKKDIRDLKDQMTLYAQVPVPVAGDTENPQGSGPPGLTKEDVEKIVQQVVQQQAAVAASAPLPADTTGLSADLGEEDLSGEPGEGAEKPVYARPWFWFLVLGVVGIAAVVVFLYLRWSTASGEDEEDEEDEELEEDEDGIEIDTEDEEEDGITVE